MSIREVVVNDGPSSPCPPDPECASIVVCDLCDNEIEGAAIDDRDERRMAAEVRRWAVEFAASLSLPKDAKHVHEGCYADVAAEVEAERMEAKDAHIPTNKEN